MSGQQQPKAAEQPLVYPPRAALVTGERVRLESGEAAIVTCADELIVGLLVFTDARDVLATGQPLTRVEMRSIDEAAKLESLG